ncbi:DUF58 domain-containing protein [Cycloclasticus sp.]|uniref:DUF58 domain-containing protein n=1 Tax=Cycloclasticus sp. TaxID=2024830 RepID=UPI00257C7A42|nr:DUF58 domain-containing protein [Cycloclasticus sp.]
MLQLSDLSIVLRMALTLSKRMSLRRFTKGEAPQHSSIQLNYRRIFILPNKGGLSLLVVILLMLIASINYNNSMGFVFSFLLAASAQMSTFYSVKNLYGLIISPSKTPPYYAGSSGQMKVLIKETKGVERWAIKASYLHQQTFFDVQKNQTLLITLPIKFKQRGWHTLDTITLSTTFPFGFFRAWSPLLFNQAILVYPQPIDSGLSLEINQPSDEQNKAASNQVGTDEFIGLKPYQQGQSYRQVNWKAFAAEKGFYSNQFSAEESISVWLDWHFCQPLDTEAKLSQLCFWLLDCEAQGLEYGLRLPGVEQPPNHGHAHLHTCLKALALYGHS